jgi:hypothetical protein
MTSSFFIGYININQNVNLYDTGAPIIDLMPNTHYGFLVDCNFQTLMGLQGNYIQNTVNPNNVDINLSFNPNSNYLKLLLGYDEVYNGSNIVQNSVNSATAGSIASGRKGSTTGVIIGDYNIGFRLLEIAAIQIFNHAQARAAIRNDTEFAAAMQSIVDSVPSLISNYNFNEETKIEMFNVYVNQNLINLNDDITSPVAFNWDAFNFQNFYQSGVQINFNMPNIFDSIGNGIDRNLYNIGNDPAVNILLLLRGANL